MKEETVELAPRFADERLNHNLRQNGVARVPPVPLANILVRDIFVMLLHVESLNHAV